MFERVIKESESLVHSTEARVRHCEMERGDVVLPRRLVQLGQDPEGISAPPREPVGQSKISNEDRGALALQQIERRLILRYRLTRMPLN